MPTSVLVPFASKYGSTAGIAARIAELLPLTTAGRQLEVTTVLQPVEHAPAPTEFDAVVAGSAVYVGRWLEPARTWVARHAATLRDRPVWLFSSGPIGAAPFPPDLPHDAEPLAQLVGARGHRVFPGRMDPALLSVGERAMVTAMRAPIGDFRDWGAIARWTEEIADELRALGLHPA
jgi:menaquinone-dependent protoporphyrinogen oxidase